MAKVVLIALLCQVKIKRWGQGTGEEEGVGCGVLIFNLFIYLFSFFPHSLEVFPAYHSHGQIDKLEVSEAEVRALQALIAKG